MTWRPRDVLVDQAHDEVLRERVAPEGLHLRLALNGVTTLQIDWPLIGRGSKRDRGWPRYSGRLTDWPAATAPGESTLKQTSLTVRPVSTPAPDLDAGAEPRVDADVEEVIALRDLPEVRRLRDHAIDLAELRRR